MLLLLFGRVFVDPWKAGWWCLIASRIVYVVFGNYNAWKAGWWCLNASLIVR